MSDVGIEHRSSRPPRDLCPEEELKQNRLGCVMSMPMRTGRDVCGGGEEEGRTAVDGRGLVELFDDGT